MPAEIFKATSARGRCPCWPAFDTREHAFYQYKNVKVDACAAWWLISTEPRLGTEAGAPASARPMMGNGGSGNEYRREGTQKRTVTPMTNIPAESEPVSFDRDVKPLFRPRDRESMQSRFDLWSYDDVTANVSAIVTQIRARHNALRRRVAGRTSRPHSAMGGHRKGTLTGVLATIWAELADSKRDQDSQLVDKPASAASS